MSDDRGRMDEAGKLMRFDAAKKSVLVAYLLWFFLGFFGLHRIYLGYVLSGLLMLALWAVGTALSIILIGYVILVLPFLWWLVDALLIPGLARDRNNAIIAEIERGAR
ncbi:MAG: TM2 domain-containing protein [Thalassobaculum sp.]|uniref:TM2 domain-containing protein n=1 Tax=Thalassobaculum sp. TaxID=2022740 RepID=UPI0032EF619C